MAVTEREKKAHSHGVGVGMVIAAAIVVHQSDVYAEEILGAAGISTIADMRKMGCDDYDINQLRSVVSEMQRRRRYSIAKRRRLSTPDALKGDAKP